MSAITGSWDCRKDSEGVQEITCEGFFIATIPGGIGEKEDKQIAGMITAAPELLAALKAIIGNPSVRMVPQDLHDAGVAAVAKAEGPQ